MSTSSWGIKTWIFFHTICEKLKDESFDIIGIQLFDYIKKLCGFLPCPECSLHSKAFFLKIPNTKIKTKDNLINALYIFHNSVNLRNNKPEFSTSNLVTYKQINLIDSYNNFARVYNTNGNLKLLTDSFNRTRLIREFKKWLMINIKHFNP